MKCGAWVLAWDASDYSVAHLGGLKLTLHVTTLLTIFNLDAENEGVNAFLIDFHFSPVELKRSVPSRITLAWAV